MKSEESIFRASLRLVRPDYSPRSSRRPVSLLIKPLRLRRADRQAWCPLLLLVPAPARQELVGGSGTRVLSPDFLGPQWVTWPPHGKVRSRHPLEMEADVAGSAGNGWLVVEGSPMRLLLAGERGQTGGCGPQEEAAPKGSLPRLVPLLPLCPEPFQARSARPVEMPLLLPGFSSRTSPSVEGLPS